MHSVVKCLDFNKNTSRLDTSVTYMRFISHIKHCSNDIAVDEDRYLGYNNGQSFDFVSF